MSASPAVRSVPNEVLQAASPPIASRSIMASPRAKARTDGPSGGGHLLPAKRPRSAVSTAKSAHWPAASPKPRSKSLQAPGRRNSSHGPWIPDASAPFNTVPH
ncbi:hypothetical protein AHiyo8_55030 [Arthrobacter sp. Hiyo8]|nr:hypothetical protein AHiyo8_55030 [Arthrobacter sp. Hiyo8]